MERGRRGRLHGLEHPARGHEVGERALHARLPLRVLRGDQDPGLQGAEALGQHQGHEAFPIQIIRIVLRLLLLLIIIVVIMIILIVVIIMIMIIIIIVILNNIIISIVIIIMIMIIIIMIMPGVQAE